MTNENEDKITLAELVTLFGDNVPAAVMDIIFNAPDDLTIGQVRAKVRDKVKALHDKRN